MLTCEPRMNKTILTVFVHADVKAFLQAAMLTSVSGVFVDLTAFVAPADISCCGPDASPEETLAGLAA